MRGSVICGVGIQRMIERCDISEFEPMSLWIHFKLLIKLSLSAEIDVWNCLYLKQVLCLYTQ